MLARVLFVKIDRIEMDTGAAEYFQWEMFWKFSIVRTIQFQIETKQSNYSMYVWMYMVAMYHFKRDKDKPIDLPTPCKHSVAIVDNWCQIISFVHYVYSVLCTDNQSAYGKAHTIYRSLS